MLTEAEATPDAIRDRVRAFLAENDPAETAKQDFNNSRFDAGLAWVHYPEGLGVDDVLQRAGDAQAAETFRVVHPGQPRVEPGVVEVLLGRLGRIVLGQEGTDPVADRVRRGFGFGQHRASS